MRWFGFGFNAFEQIRVEDPSRKQECSDAVGQVNVVSPTALAGHVGRGECSSKCECKVKACWSRRASLHLNGKYIGENLALIIDAGFFSIISNQLKLRCVLTLLSVSQVTAVCV